MCTYLSVIIENDKADLWVQILKTNGLPPPKQWSLFKLD